MPKKATTVMPMQVGRIVFMLLSYVAQDQSASKRARLSRHEAEACSAPRHLGGTQKPRGARPDGSRHNSGEDASVDCDRANLAPQRRMNRSTALAKPSSSQESVTALAWRFTSSLALPMAMLKPDRRNIRTSLG